MIKSKSWLDADHKGLRALMLARPKWFAVREIIANAFDETDATYCEMNSLHEKGFAIVTIEDNSPTGFRNIKDAYTLFGNCEKRPDVTKRGRFNKGEKEAIVICEHAVISTTTGTVIFSKCREYVEECMKTEAE